MSDAAKLYSAFLDDSAGYVPVEFGASVVVISMAQASKAIQGAPLQDNVDIITGQHNRVMKIRYNGSRQTTLQSGSGVWIKFRSFLDLLIAAYDLLAAKAAKDKLLGHLEPQSASMTMVDGIGGEQVELEQLEQTRRQSRALARDAQKRHGNPGVTLNVWKPFKTILCNAPPSTNSVLAAYLEDTSETAVKEHLDHQTLEGTATQMMHRVLQRQRELGGHSPQDASTWAAKQLDQNLRLANPVQVTREGRWSFMYGPPRDAAFGISLEARKRRRTEKCRCSLDLPTNE